MHREIIMVVAADLRYCFSNEQGQPGHPDIYVGPETARACNKAVRLAREHSDALVFATAGYSPKHRLLMGDGPMRRFLEGCSDADHRIRTPAARAFNTNGEMEELAKHLQPGDTVRLVCRCWHLPRALLLLRARLGRERRKLIEILPVPVWTFHDPLGMALEPFAWLKNARNLIGAF